MTDNTDKKIIARSFTTPLELEYIDGQNWKVTAPFEYHLINKDGIEFVRINPGFITDFASVPKPFWNVLPPTGKYGKAAVIHDKLYRDREILTGDITDMVSKVRLCDRIEADDIFNEAMKVLNVGWLVRTVLYRGVRMISGKAWNEYRGAAHV